ncbi:serpin B10-like [Galendromus occidentalis]|uniref:Serpin B10-like n=1 Tax=Galendromus occidentalis TaxID=34638 RepID=A0AAJ6QVI9_9ACAR|nr:serpin B10-like [Galendromus occidentalis]
MLRALKKFTLVLFVVIVYDCSANDYDDQKLQQLSRGIGKLSIEILKKVAADEENTIFSAYGISSALALCLLGSEGQTRAALREVLGLASLNDAESLRAFRDTNRMILGAGSLTEGSNGNLTLSSANAIFANESLRIRPEFLGQMHEVFEDSLVQSVDFADDAHGIQKYINSFVGEATHGRIPDLLSQPLDTQTLLAVVNAVYYKGSWKTALKVKQSVEGFNNFPCPTREMQPGPKPQWMTLTSKLRYARSRTLNAHFLELPYQSGDNIAVSMILVLPYDGMKCDFSGWIQRTLDWNLVAEVLTEMSETRIDLTLPKLKLKGTYDMKKTLTSLGLGVVFSNQASFEAMLSDQNRPVPISNFLHKAEMSVDELGTEAAAASGAFLRRRSRPLPAAPPIELVFDRSFLSMIVVDQNGVSLPLFTAVVNEIVA